LVRAYSLFIYLFIYFLYKIQKTQNIIKLKINEKIGHNYTLERAFESEKLELVSTYAFWFNFGSVNVIVIEKLSGNLSERRLSISNWFFGRTIENLKEIRKLEISKKKLK